MEPPQLVKVDIPKTPETPERKEIRAFVTFRTKGQFEENLELENFPFDVQWFHVRMHMAQVCMPCMQ